MNFLTRFSLKNPVAVLILSVLLMFGGAYAFTSLKVDLLPDIEFPAITIQSVYPGASPQDVNEKVTTPLEKKLKTLDGLEKMTSQSFESASVVQLTFPIGTDMEKITQKVNDLLKETSLPEGVEPKSSRFSFSAIPIIQVALFDKNSGDVEQIMNEQIKPELMRIPGVNNVAVSDSEENLLQIVVDKDKAKAAGLTLDQIRQAITNRNLSFPAGTVTQERIVVPVRVEDKVTKIEELKKLTLTPGATAAQAAGSLQMGSGAAGQPRGGSIPGLPVSRPVALGEIAKFETIADQNELTRYDRKDSIAIAITKKQDANTVELTAQAYEVLNRHKDKIDYAIVFDQATGIEKSVNSLQKEGLFGALFASLAVLVFLRNLRATLIAIVSIPLSLLVASIFLSRFAITLNVMTLGGMAVAVGRVVDDSIVVIENIFRRIKQKGDSADRTQLTADATKEVLSAITSSTLTTVVVFLPLGLVGGVTGEFFLPFALTVIFALLMSLLAAVTVVPILARFSFAKIKHEEKERWLQRVYTRTLRWSLGHKSLVLLLSLVLLAGSFALVPGLGFTFLPNEKQKILMASVQLPASTELQKTNELAKKVEDLLSKRDTVAHVFAGIGSRDYQTGLRRSNTAQFFIELKESADSKREVEVLREEISKAAGSIEPETVTNVQEMSTGGPPTNNNVDIDLYSDNQEKLAEASRLVENELKNQPKLRDITNNYQATQKQWVVRLDADKADAAGISSFMVLGLVSDQTRPVQVGSFNLDGKERTLRLAYDKALTSKSELEDLTVFGKKGPLKLKEVAAVEQIDAVSAIQKLDGKVYARVTAQVDDPDTFAVSKQVMDHVKTLQLPEGVSLNTGSGSQETQQTFKDLFVAMAVAIGLVYLVMLVTFGKARIPFIILTSLLFVPLGAIAGLWLIKEPVSVSALIGVLMLIGIVVTNAIVLIDRVGQNRDAGMTIRDSLIEAGRTRLRPILMTAFATICALLPLAFSVNEGNLISKGLAVVVIGGLTTSTLLTLLIVPIMYEIFFRRTVKQEVNEGGIRAV